LIGLPPALPPLSVCGFTSSSVQEVKVAVVMLIKRIRYNSFFIDEVLGIKII